jgi:hypothetical protein
VGNSIEGIRAVSNRVVAVEIRVVIAAAAVVVVAVGVWIVSPARIAGAHKEGGGEVASAVTVAIAVTGAVRSTNGRIIGIIGAGTDGQRDRGTQCGGPWEKVFPHVAKTARLRNIFEGFSGIFHWVLPHGLTDIGIPAMDAAP